MLQTHGDRDVVVMQHGVEKVVRLRYACFNFGVGYTRLRGPSTHPQPVTSMKDARNILLSSKNKTARSLSLESCS